MRFPLAHSAPGLGILLGLLFVSVAAGLGVLAFVLFNPSGARPPRRGLAITVAVLAGVSVVLAYVFPVVIKGTPQFLRPSSPARLSIVSPGDGEVERGDPASVLVVLNLEGGTLTQQTSSRLLPNVGHIHLYLDGTLVSMTVGLQDRIDVAPGTHTLEVEYVATDHAPFNPRVRASVPFEVADEPASSAPG